MGLTMAEACRDPLHMHWFALTVKPRHEKAVAEHLLARSLESYAPVYRERRRWSDRLRTVELPLFPRYVFCRFSFADRLKVISMPSVQSVVGFGGEPAPVQHEEIDAVKTLAGSGLEGILAREKSGYRVVINVELLQRAVAVEIDRNFVGTIDGAQSALASLS